MLDTLKAAGWQLQKMPVVATMPARGPFDRMAARTFVFTHTTSDRVMTIVATDVNGQGYTLPVPERGAEQTVEHLDAVERCGKPISS